MISLFEEQAKASKIRFVLLNVAGHELRTLHVAADPSFLSQAVLPEKLQGDELRFQQVLIHIMRNALIFT